jgi:hypothetical protein
MADWYSLILVQVKKSWCQGSCNCSTGIRIIRKLSHSISDWSLSFGVEINCLQVVWKLYVNISQSLPLIIRYGSFFKSRVMDSVFLNEALPLVINSLSCWEAIKINVKIYYIPYASLDLQILSKCTPSVLYLVPCPFSSLDTTLEQCVGSNLVRGKPLFPWARYFTLIAQYWLVQELIWDYVYKLIASYTINQNKFCVNFVYLQ